MRREVIGQIDGVPVHLWRPKPEQGDYCTDVAFVCAKVFGGTAREWAERIVRSFPT